MCGYVTYTNRAKRKCLGVKKSTLKKEGAVSAKCARQMAKGGAKAAKTDVCLSVTGLAGGAVEQRRHRWEPYLWDVTVQERQL